MASHYLYGTMSDKKTGALLTPTMREFYRGNSEQTGSKARSVRQRTRDRFCAGIQDINMLYLSLRDKDRRAIVDNLNNTVLADAISNFVAIFVQELDTQQFESIFETGIRKALKKEGYSAADVTVTIDVEHDAYSIDEILDKIEQGQSLSESEASYLLSITPDQIPEEQAERLQGSISLSVKEENGPTTGRVFPASPVILDDPLTPEDSTENK